MSVLCESDKLVEAGGRREINGMRRTRGLLARVNSGMKTVTSLLLVLIIIIYAP